MPEFKELTLAECVDIIEAIPRPLVAMHIRPDGDTVGSGAALCEIFKALGRDVKYACADGIPERLAFLVEGLSRAEDPEGFDGVTIDVPSQKQLGELEDRLNVCLMIDHHKVNTPFAPNYTVHTASSAGEVLLDIARELQRRGRISLTKKMATMLYAAISSDTGGFAYSNAGEKTYRDAADLIALGIDQADINHRIFMSKTKEQLLAEGFTASRIRTAREGLISYAVITREDMIALGVNETYFDCAIDVVRSLLGAEIAFVVKETERGFKASLRSTGANVAQIAALHSGGGHIRAAGCTVTAESAEDAANIILSELDELF